MKLNFTYHWTITILVLFWAQAVIAFSARTTITEQGGIVPPGTISGRVVDENNQPVPGANVVVTGTTTGTSTDVTGNYRLTVPEVTASTTLTFSYIGYTSQVITIGTRTTLNVSLRPSAGSALNEVVVVGYGTQRRGSLTGAVNQISSRNIESKPVLNTLQALQGEAPNLIIQQSSLDPGSGVNLNIRGLGTLGDNTPLVVIDGIIGGDINTINPNDIENVSVLKDAGAAAIYGSRAANGVILVTTKSGKVNQKPSISYAGNFGVQNPRVLVEKVNAGQNAEYKNQSLINAELPPVYTAQQIQALRDAGNGTWDIEHLLHNAPQQSHNVSVSGGGESSAYYISAGYQDQKSNLIGNGGSGADFGFTKYNLRLNETSVIGKLRANFILNYTKTRNKTNTVGNNNIFADANRVPANFSWQDENGNYLTNEVASEYNELGVLERGGANQSDNDQVFGSFNGQFNITEDIKVTGIFGGTLNNNNNFFRRIQVNYVPSGVYGSDRTVFDNNRKNNLFNTQLFAEYNKTITNHTFRVLLGVSNESFSNRGFQVQQTLTDPYLGIPTTGTLVDPVNSYNSIAIDQTSLTSIFGRMNYNYKNKYLLESTFRVDASSRFAAGNRAGFFPSLNLGWLVTEESFMETLKSTISNLKLRATYGVLGNQNVGSFQYLSTFSNYPAAYGFNGSAVGGANFNFSNPDLTWEKAATFNIGIDVGFLKNKLTASFDYFNKVTRDILNSRQDVPLLFGLSQFPDYNVAKVKNTGWDFVATYNFKTGAADQSITFNIADNKNKLLALTGGVTQQIQNQDVFQLIRQVGQPITEYYGFKTNGYFQDQADVQNYPKPTSGAAVGPGDVKFADLNNDGRIDDNDKTVLGNPFPRYTFGFTYRVSLKGFDAMIFIQGVGKRDAFLRGELVEPFHYNYGATVYEHQTDIWTPENPDARFPRLAAVGSQSNTNNWRTGSDLYKFNAAYARLKNINIGYTIPAATTKKFGVQRFRVSLIAQNLITLSKLTFIDPETTEFGNNLNLNAGSNSARSYPLPVFYGAGLDLTF
ncbi:MAG TPA: TonB-dependent receptor [Pedobacter sp.]|nr:TonB-dependent receptor [Pedobacter sp.]